MGIPSFLLRKLYKRGSLRETGDGRFGFSLRNPLATATVVAPPLFVVNGVSYQAQDVEAPDVELAGISEAEPYEFAKGAELALSFPGRLLRGGNRIHVMVTTKEFGDLDFLVEDREAELEPDADSEEE